MPLPRPSSSRLRLAVAASVLVLSGFKCHQDERPPQPPAPPPPANPGTPAPTRLERGSHDRFTTTVDGHAVEADVRVRQFGTGAEPASIDVEARGVPESRIRWVQIVVNTDQNGNRTRPNFDGPTTKGEGDTQERRNRQRAHDVFDRGQTHTGGQPAPPRFFDDWPSSVPTDFNYFEAYLVMLVITEDPSVPSWTTSIARVYHWVWRRGDGPGQEDRLEVVTPQDGGFVAARTGAVADFGGNPPNFDFGQTYAGTPPPR